MSVVRRGEDWLRPKAEDVGWCLPSNVSKGEFVFYQGFAEAVGAVVAPFSAHSLRMLAKTRDSS